MGLLDRMSTNRAEITYVHTAIRYVSQPQQKLQHPQLLQTENELFFPIAKLYSTGLQKLKHEPATNIVIKNQPDLCILLNHGCSNI